MTACANCGRELPEGALFCPECGARAVDYSIAPSSSLSPSHFNSGMTVTSSQPMAEPTAPIGGRPSPVDAAASPHISPPLSPEERRRKQELSSFSSSSPRRRTRRGLIAVIIGTLVVLLVGTLLWSGMVGTSGPGTIGGGTVNSASTPLTGEQLYAAYASNQSQADASYTNKTVYIQDSLDAGVLQDGTTGQYYSYLDSGAVILVWSSQSQVGQLYPGATVLARCHVAGARTTSLGFFSGPGPAYSVYLQDCDLLNVQTQTGTATSASISVANA